MELHQTGEWWKEKLLVSVPFSTKGDYLLTALCWQRSSGIISQSGTSGATPMWHKAWIKIEFWHATHARSYPDFPVSLSGHLFGLPFAVITGASVTAAVRCAYRFLLGMNHFVAPNRDVLASASASVWHVLLLFSPCKGQADESIWCQDVWHSTKPLTHLYSSFSISVQIL